jgi:hypothetical protein
MLVSTQTMLLNIVRSDPPMHEGDAYVGNLWMNELNTSSVLEDVDFIGVGHANATDDYVTWENGEGEIVANWTVDIETECHPDYCVMFSLMAYNIDDNNSEMDTNYSEVNYDADTKYNDDGQLRLSIQFDQKFLENNTEATLVCYLNAAVKINNTEEAVNFTTWGQDRCIVGVLFNPNSSFEPYSHFREEGNDNFPNIWSWLPEWNESSRFDDEQDMLENQTFFYVSGNEQSEEGDWHFGEFDITMGPGFQYVAQFNYLSPIYHLQFDNEGKQNVNPCISLDYSYLGGPELSLNRIYVIHEGDSTIYHDHAQYDETDMGTPMVLHDYHDVNSNDRIWFAIQAWSWGVLGHTRITLPGLVVIDEGVGSLQPSGSPVGGYYWMDRCGYYNTTYTLDVDSSTNFGITTIDCDISDILLDNGQYIYTYAGDVGDTQIELTCT